MAVQVTEDAGAEDAALRRVGSAVSLVPAVGSAGPLVVLMSACSVEALRTLASSWSGPVLVVGSAEEARAVLGTAAPAGARPEDAGAARPEVTGGPDTPAERSARTEVVPGLQLDADRRVVGDGRTEVPLTPLELDFLLALEAHPGRLRTFEQLQQEVWGTPHIGDVTQVHSLVKRLRRTLRRLELPLRVQAVRGVGFRLVRAGHLAPVGR